MRKWGGVQDAVDVVEDVVVVEVVAKHRAEPGDGLRIQVGGAVG